MDVAVVLHKYVLPPLAVNVANPPIQTLLSLLEDPDASDSDIEIVGIAFTVTVILAVFEQPEVVPVTV